MSGDKPEEDIMLSDATKRCGFTSVSILVDGCASIGRRYLSNLRKIGIITTQTTLHSDIALFATQKKLNIFEE